MKALVVYESLFGNTEQVAQAITRGLSEHLEVELVEVSKAPLVITEPLTLIVIGGPTHAFSMTKESPRKLGFEAAAKPESFYVQDVSGPLLDGELERAKAWGDDWGIGPLSTTWESAGVAARFAMGAGTGHAAGRSDRNMPCWSMT